MKIIVVAFIVIFFISSSNCVQNQVEGDGIYKDLHGRVTRKLPNEITVDGRTDPDGRHHTCPPHKYPCTDNVGK